jgi:hypothetical protein
MPTRMLGALGLIALVCCAALFVASAGEASFPGANGTIAFTSDRAAVGVAGTDPPAWTTARRDRVVVRDDGISELYALDGMLLYARVENLGPDGSQPATTRPWMRVVNGLQLQVRGMPTDSRPVSIGRDATGRVVVVLAQNAAPSGEVVRWWLYDVARDAARRLRVPAEKGCAIDTVAVWRGRVAEAARCCRLAEPARCSRLQEWRVVVREGASTTRVTKKNAGFFVSTLVLRNRSLVGIVIEGRFERTLWRFLDRGRRCPKVIGGTSDENGFWVGIGSGTLTWAIARWTGDFITHDLFEVGDIELSGHCQSAPRKRYTAPSLLPQTPIHGSYGPSGPAIDGRKLYYATDTAIHLLRLPARRAVATSREG